HSHGQCSSQFVADSSCRTLHAGDTVWPNLSMKTTPKEFASRLGPFRDKLTRSLPRSRPAACPSMSVCLPQLHSVCLPWHPAVAYLVFVRPLHTRSARSSSTRRNT